MYQVKMQGADMKGADVGAADLRGSRVWLTTPPSSDRFRDAGCFTIRCRAAYEEGS